MRKHAVGVVWIALVGALAGSVDAKERDDLELALAGVNHPEPLPRLRAQWNLEALAGEGSVKPLLELLEKHQKLRKESVSAIVQVLGELGVAEALPHFVKLAHEGSEQELRVSAAVGLARLQSDAGRAALRELVRDPQTKGPIRELSLVALGMLEDEAVVALSRDMLARGKPGVRRAAYRALGYSQAPGALDVVKVGLNDKEPLVSSMAAWAMAKLHGEAYVPKLRKYVDRMQRGGLRFMLLDALARLGEEKALREVITRAYDARDPLQYEALLTIAETSEKRGADALRSVLQQHLKGKQSREAGLLAAFTLGKLQDQKSLEVLVTALTGARGVELRRAAAKALGHLRNAQAERALIATSYNRDLLVRVNSLVALSRIGSTGNWKKLRKALKDRDAIVRYSAVVAVEAARDPKSARLLKPLLKDREPFVRAAARQAIELLAGNVNLAMDGRDAKLLDRFHALEREYVFKGRGIGDPYSNAKRAKLKSVEEQLRVASYGSTCGGSHPPIIDHALVERLEAQAEGLRRSMPSQEAMLIQGQWREQTEDTYDLRRTRTKLERERSGGASAH